MRLYGYGTTSEELHLLREVTIASSPEDLRLIASFLKNCADGMDGKSADEWSHEHLQDSAYRLDAATSDIIVAQAETSE